MYTHWRTSTVLASKEGLLCRTWNNFFNRRRTHSSRRYGVVCFDPNFVSDHIFVCFDFIIKASYVSIGNGFQSGYGVSNIQWIFYTQFACCWNQWYCCTLHVGSKYFWLCTIYVFRANFIVLFSFRLTVRNGFFFYKRLCNSRPVWMIWFSVMLITLLHTMVLFYCVCCC